VRTAATSGISAAAAVPAAAAAAAAIGTGRIIVRWRLETEGGAAPPYQKQGHLGVVPAKEERAMGNGTQAAGATVTSPAGAARVTESAAAAAAAGATVAAGSIATGPATEPNESSAPFKAPDPGCRCFYGILP
jgi:hypothetical protein